MIVAWIWAFMFYLGARHPCVYPIIAASAPPLQRNTDLSGSWMVKLSCGHAKDPSSKTSMSVPGLDPLKWLMAYLGNEDGVRDRYSYHKKTRKVGALPSSVHCSPIQSGAPTGAAEQRHACGNIKQRQQWVTTAWPSAFLAPRLVWRQWALMCSTLESGRLHPLAA